MFAVRGFTRSLIVFQTRNILPVMATAPSNCRFSSFSTTHLDTTNSPSKRVGTHNGSFHCDEALGCFMIRLTHKFWEAEIVRTRDPKVLETLDAVLDVGGVYEPSKDRYDHHQKGFDEVFGHGFSTKLSSAGLVYKHYGMEIIAKELKLDQGHPNVHRLYLAVYKSFVEAIDAKDNGVNKYDTDLPKRYVNSTSLSSRVGKLNLDWMDPDKSSEKENESFHLAMSLAGSEFVENVQYHARSWLSASSIVMECLAAREDVDASGEIMTLTKFCPWKLHLIKLEEDMKIHPTIKYVIYEDERSKNWRVEAVAVTPEKFESRKGLPVKWRGLRGEQLSEESGIPGCVFVHISGFIGGNSTYQGALAMARSSLTFQ